MIARTEALARSSLPNREGRIHHSEKSSGVPTYCSRHAIAVGDLEYTRGRNPPFPLIRDDLDFQSVEPRPRVQIA
jgi:hypothetical protein